MVGVAVTTLPTPTTLTGSSNVEVGDGEGILLDELTARLDHVAHQPGEDLVGDIGLVGFDPEERAVRRIERGFPQLLGVHLAKAFIALELQSPAPGGQDGIEQFRRAGYLDRLALDVLLLSRLFTLF